MREEHPTSLRLVPWGDWQAHCSCGWVSGYNAEWSNANREGAWHEQQPDA